MIDRDSERRKEEKGRKDRRNATDSLRARRLDNVPGTDTFASCTAIPPHSRSNEWREDSHFVMTTVVSRYPGRLMNTGFAGGLMRERE
jgi:hypothetical protein